MTNEENQKMEIERLSTRLDEYVCGWNRQQMIINNLTKALIDQEIITLSNLRATTFFRGLRNSIQPDELDEYIFKIKAGVK